MPKPTPLTDAEVLEFTKNHPEWSTAKGPLTRTWDFANFAQAMQFVIKVGDAAEAADHHPDFDIRWKKVTLAFITHDAGNTVTALDTTLAAQAEQIASTLL